MDLNSAWTYNANDTIANTDNMGYPNQGWLDTSEDGSYSVITEPCPTLTVGDLVWQDDDNDGIKDATESGVDGVALQLWTPGVNGTRENGGGDDQFFADAVSFNGGFYQFQDVLAGVYYVRIPNPPASLRHCHHDEQQREP